jgi:7 transmembrane sweet-taste receptor of 3 GCPR/Receptor family ligand binding region
MRSVMLPTLIALAAVVHADPQLDGSCRLVSLLPFSDASVFTSRGANRTSEPPYSKFSRWTAETISMTGYTYAAAVMLAMEHFNNRDSSVIPEIASLPKDCTAFFTNESTVVDGALSNVRSGQLLFEAAIKSKPCAVVGPYGVLPSSWTSPLSASIDVPQLFYATAPSIVTEPDYYANTIRMTLHTDDYASKIISLVAHQKRDHLAIVLGGADYDRTLAIALERAGPDFNVTVTSFPLFPPNDKIDPMEHANRMFGKLKDSGIRTIFRTFIDRGPKALKSTAGGANAKGLLEDDYLYILEDNIAPPDDIAQIMGSVDKGSPVDKLLSGAIIVSPAEVWESGADSLFLQSWRNQSAGFVNLVNQNVPLNPEQPEYMQGSPDFFQTHNPRRGAAFVYDSVMAIGFGACNMPANETAGDSDEKTPAHNESAASLADDATSTGGVRFLQTETQNMGASSGGRQPPQGCPPPNAGPPPDGVPLPEGCPPPNGGTPPINGGSQSGGPPAGDGSQGGPPARGLDITNRHVKGIIRSTFTGASGRVAYGQKGEMFKDRVAGDVSFGAYNIRPIDQLDGTRRYEVVLVTRTTSAGWETVPGRTFIYRDGASVLKGPGRVIPEQNFLASAVTIFGITLMSIAWVVSLGLLMAVWIWRGKPLVKAGQPVFLGIVCFGSFLTSSAIFPLSFDESHGWNDSQLDAACTLTPWLFFLGINSMFAGLFCKLWRVDQVTQFRRRQVKIIQAAWPLVRCRSCFLCAFPHSGAPYNFGFPFRFSFWCQLQYAYWSGRWWTLGPGSASK